MRIVFFTYESDAHCPECAEERFGHDALALGTAIDVEGNFAHPVFDISEDAPGLACRDCGATCDVV